MDQKLSKILKNSITITLILSMVTFPFLGATHVYAQTVDAGFNTGSAYPTGNPIIGGISGYLQVLTPAIRELPLCKNKISGTNIKGLFSKDNRDLLAIEAANNNLSQLESNEFSNTAEAIATINKTQDKLQEESLKEQKKQTSRLSSLEENDTCLKSLGRMVTKMLLQKITVSTVSWINSGFEGKPLFLQDSGKFFGDIAKNEILQFRVEIDNPTLYPFGRSFLKTQADAYNRRFAQNAVYSMNDLIQNTTPEYSVDTFNADFSLGGWNAWNALTQVPANNPLGFNILASDELALRLRGTSSSVAEQKRVEIAQSSGFLGDERCTEDHSITKSDHLAALERNEKEVVYDLIEDPDSEPIEVEIETGRIVGTCPGNSWEYVTPGNLIAEAATKTLNYPDNNLLRADDLNGAISAIMDALLNRWTSDIANRGFANFSNTGVDGSFILDNTNRTIGSTQQVYLDFPEASINSSWLRTNSDFNIRTDLNQALIDEQRIYQEKLKEQNQTLDHLITTVYQLDYCIPGPHPGFEQDSRRTLQAVKNSIPSKTPSDFEDIETEQILALVESAGVAAGAAIGASIGTAVFPGFGTLVGAAIGTLVGAIVNIFGGDSNEEKLDYYYSGIGQAFTGLHLGDKVARGPDAPSPEKAKITGKQDVTLALDAILDRYIDLIENNYPIDFLPAVTQSANIEFRKIPGYREKIENNEYAISVLNGIIVRLAELKDELDTMDPETNSYADYFPLISEFSRLSSSMVTGNDIGRVVDEIKESSSQIKYIWENLLKGDFGCEKQVLSSDLDPRLRGRVVYPFPIWSDYTSPRSVPSVLEEYGIDTGGGMPSLASGLNKGFLSEVRLDSTTSQCLEFFRIDLLEGGNPPEFCLRVHDLFIHVNEADVWAGRNTGSEQDGTSFEQTIGIY